MKKYLVLIPLLLVPFVFMIPSIYATDQIVSLDTIFGHLTNFNLGDKLILLNNDTNFSHDFKAISKEGYTRSTPSLFPKDSFPIQFEQPGNYTISDDFNNKNIGYIDVINTQPIQTTTLNNTTTSTISFSGTSNATNIASISSPSTTSNDATYWKSQALTWKFLAQQYYSQLQALQTK